MSNRKGVGNLCYVRTDLSRQKKTAASCHTSGEVYPAQADLPVFGGAPPIGARLAKGGRGDQGSPQASYFSLSFSLSSDLDSAGEDAGAGLNCLDGALAGPACGLSFPLNAGTAPSKPRDAFGLGGGSTDL